MDPATLKPWLDIFVSYGVPLVITVGVLVLLWRYIPKWIDSSILAQTLVPQELAKLNETLSEGSKDMHRMQQAAKHGARAAAKVLRTSASGADVHMDIAAMLKALGDDDD